MLLIGKLNYHNFTFVHELYSQIKFMEDDGLVNMCFGNWSQFDDAFRNNSKVALVTQNELVDIRT